MGTCVMIDSVCFIEGDCCDQLLCGSDIMLRTTRSQVRGSRCKWMLFKILQLRWIMRVISQKKFKRKNNDEKSPISIITALLPAILVAFFVFFEVIKPPFLRTMAIRFA